MVRRRREAVGKCARGCPRDAHMPKKLPNPHKDWYCKLPFTSYLWGWWHHYAGNDLKPGLSAPYLSVLTGGLSRPPLPQYNGLRYVDWGPALLSLGPAERRVKILCLGPKRNLKSIFSPSPKRGGYIFSQCLGKGGQNRGAYLPTSLRGHNFPPAVSWAGSHHASLNPSAASNAFLCNFANTGPRDSIQLSNRCAICWKSHV